MSSVRKELFILPILLPIAAAGSASQQARDAAQPAPISSPQVTVSAADIGAAINEWRALRRAGTASFDRYARFLNDYPGWPGETVMRRNAERVIGPMEDPGLVRQYFASQDPQTGRGWARLADAQLAARDMTAALVSAREALASGDLDETDESALIARFGGQFTTSDYERRVDALLAAGKPDLAERLLPRLSPTGLPVLKARIALNRRSGDAESLYTAVRPMALKDAGLLYDRVRYLRAEGRAAEARLVLAQQRTLGVPPAHPEPLIEAMERAVKEADSAGDHGQLYNIARQTSDLFAPGTRIDQESYAIRDALTTINWLGGLAAMDHLKRPADAAILFQRYAESGRSLQVASKGYYWAGRAMQMAGDSAAAQRWYAKSAESPEVFYSQLALERLGRAMPRPANARLGDITPTERTYFFREPLVRALRTMIQYGSRDEQHLFVRALSERLKTAKERDMGIELSRSLARPDLAVWIARSARNSGDHYYVAEAYPSTPTISVRDPHWAMTQAITRQESSFDRTARSPVGAMGMMQLMPGTAREQAAKLGLPYNYADLSNPTYNVRLGHAYYQRMLGSWNGSRVLAAASYNAGPGNAARWIRRYGDPRGSVDVLRWIEAIPFEETRGYVQRVVENGVVYDTLNPAHRGGPVHISTYLGKERQPG